MEGVHHGLALVVEADEEDPGEAEKQDKAIEKEEGGESRFLRLLVYPVEPKHLGESDEGDRAIAGME